MFAIIDTKGATHILINIPLEGAEKSLPALAAMLENNAVCIRQSWREFALVKPEMSIKLGNAYNVSDSETADLVVQASPEVLGEDWVVATPEVLTSNKAALAKKDVEIRRISAELEHTKMKLKDAVETMARMNGEAEEL